MSINRNNMTFHLAVVAAAAAAVLMLSGCGTKVPPSVDTLRLGEPALSKKVITVKPGEIYSGATGKPITLDRLADEIAGMRYVFLGESHTSMANHELQFKIIEALHARNPKLKIGMEFFKRHDNETLELWSAGKLSEEELLHRTGWYDGGGGYNFGYYRAIMNFARDNRLPVVGLNVPRSITRKIAMGGFDSLSPEERAEVGEVDVDNEQHRELIRFYFGGTGGDESAMHFTADRFEKMYAAQRTWDVVMGDSAIRAADGFDGTVVVIAGSGHVAYNLGIPRAVHDKTGQPFASVVAVDDHGRQGKGGYAVRSLANYIGGISYDTEPGYYPSFGFTVSNKEGKLMVGIIYPNSLAMKAGLTAGDRVLALDGEPVDDVTGLRMRLAAKNWGETAVLLVERGGETVPVEIALEK